MFEISPETLSNLLQLATHGILALVVICLGVAAFEALIRD